VALTVVPVKTFVTGDRREVIADVTFDNSYTTGGLALTAATLGLTSVDVVVSTPAVTGQIFPYDLANSRLLAFAGATQVNNGTDLSALRTRVVAHGKGPGLS
jgi:hypothetical protein